MLDEHEARSAPPAPRSRRARKTPVGWEAQRHATRPKRAGTALGPIPAKVLATELDPDATRARPPRRGLQMVLRLLTFNAEAWLAEHLNAYLADPTSTAPLPATCSTKAGTSSTATPRSTITLDRPDSPRIARALHLLADELNNTPARLPGDRRPITYHVRPARISTLNPTPLPEV